MDRGAAHRRLSEAGLAEDQATALIELLWNVHATGQVAEVDLAHLSDAGFRHVEVCIIRELLLAALSRPRTRGSEAPVLTLLGAFSADD